MELLLQLLQGRGTGTTLIVAAQTINKVQALKSVRKLVLWLTAWDNSDEKNQSSSDLCC